MSITKNTSFPLGRKEVVQSIIIYFINTNIININAEVLLINILNLNIELKRGLHTGFTDAFTYTCNVIYGVWSKLNKKHKYFAVIRI